MVPYQHISTKMVALSKAARRVLTACLLLLNKPRVQCTMCVLHVLPSEVLKTYKKREKERAIENSGESCCAQSVRARLLQITCAIKEVSEESYRCILEGVVLKSDSRLLRNRVRPWKHSAPQTPTALLHGWRVDVSRSVIKRSNPALFRQVTARISDAPSASHHAVFARFPARSTGNWFHVES